MATKKQATTSPEQKEAQQWLKDIAAYDTAFKKWEGRVEKILKRYRDELRNNRDGEAKFNILWSNVQTLVPAVFSRVPKPDVSRRFNDNDQVGRVASLILERALDYEVQHYADYRTTLKQDILDRFLGGRGTAWVRYEPHFRAVAQELPTDGDQVTEDIDEPQEELDYECAPVDYVHWKDFGHSVARSWDEVTRVWRLVYMNRPQLVARFGEEIGNKIPLDSRPDEMRQRGPLASMEGEGMQAVIIEGWDKEKKEAVWISKSLGEFVDRKPDPLKLENFWPCPKPLYATLTNDSLIPVPDFTLYQDQANELDILCDRIDGLIKALKVRGVYDASVPELGRLFTEGENGTLIPVKNWQAFADKMGLKGAVDLVDIAPIAKALMDAYNAMEQVKGQVYELTGISDIVRGQSEASETATAQRIKGQYASLRLKSYQDDVARFATECLQLKAQIICSKFDPQTILTMAAAEQLNDTDKKLIPQAMALLIGQERMMDPASDGVNPLRSFRVEVAADSMVLIDEQAEKESATEFLTAVGGFLQQGAEVAQSAPDVVPLLFELIKFGAQKFRAGRQIEGVIDAALDQIKQKMQQQAMQPPPPDPKLEAEKIKADALKAKVQSEQQIAPIKAQAEMVKAKAGVIQAQTDLQTAQVQATMPPPVVQPGAMQ
jgi:hypothetical protein